MCVDSFLYFLFFLSISESQSNRKEALKYQLDRSITQISQILADAEKKIGRERRIISQIDKELNENRGAVGVDYGINIFWNSSTTQAAVSHKFGNFTYIIKSTPLLYPLPPTTSTLAAHPANWHLTTQAAGGSVDSPYIEDLKKNMELKNYGYFTSFLDEFSELVFSKNLTHGYIVAGMLSFLIKKNIKEGRFVSLGDDILTALTVIMTWFDVLPPALVQQQAGLLHHYIPIRERAWSDDWNKLINYYEGLFTKEEGQELFDALELFFVYPEANITLRMVGNSIFQAFTNPYFRIEGTRKQRRLTQLLLMAAHDVDPHWRTQTEAIPAKGFNVGSVMQDLPGRRSMNYEKVVRHFLRKHPKLFKKIKKQYKHDKKNKHQHFSHKQKRHHNYHKSRGGHHGHGDKYESEKKTQRAHLDKGNSANEDIEDESSKSNADYGENPQKNSRENMHSVQFTQTPKKQLKKLKQRRQMPIIEAKPRQSKLLKGTRTASLSIEKHPNVEQVDSPYLKELAIRFLKKKQKNKNFHRNRRLNIPSSEEDICDHSQFLEDTVENVKLHKIREASSYSDEEDHLRMNLYDALRHGNRTFASFRKSNGDVINKQTLRDLSSEADDEWILKKNIYKVFGQE